MNKPADPPGMTRIG